MPNFPGSLDSLANPSATTLRNDPGFELHTVISTLNDIAEAVEGKIGTGVSTATANKVLGADGAGTSSWRQVAAADIAAGAMPTKLVGFTLASPAALDFPSISNAYASLLLIIHGRLTAAAQAVDSLILRANADTGANYYNQRVLGSGTSVSAGETQADTAAQLGALPAATSPGGTYFSAVVVFLPGYASASGFHPILTLNTVMYGASAGLLQARFETCHWATAAPITRLQVQGLAAASLATGSRATLYGLP
jgi:hypothetical protein